LVLVLFLIGAGTWAQECPIINFPRPGSTEIPVNTTITWPPVDGIIGYSLTLGSFPGGEDILTRRSAGLTNSFTAPTGLPENTRIYVTISMFLGDGRFIFCSEEMFFETEDVTTIPPCTTLSVPQSRDQNVNNEAEISWNYAPTATGYRLTIGTSPGGSDETLTLFCGLTDLRDRGGCFGRDDEHEDIRFLVIPEAEALDGLATGRYNNASTIVALQWLALNSARLRGGDTQCANQSTD